MTLEQFLSECERLEKETTKGPWSAGPQNGNYGHNIMADLGRTLIAAVRSIQAQNPVEKKEIKIKSRAAFLENPVKGRKLTLLEPGQQAGKE